MVRHTERADEGERGHAAISAAGRYVVGGGRRARRATYAPAVVTLASARDVDLQSSGVIRSIIKARETILGATPDDRLRPSGLFAEMQSLGWGVLAAVPGREIVVGAVTRPWEANVTFRALPPDQFATFSEPGYVKIAWTLRAEPSDRINIPDRNARDRYRPRRAGEVPEVLVVPVSRHHRDSLGDAPAPQKGR